jgi:hypothetical protein
MGIDCSGTPRSANRMAKELARLLCDELAVGGLMAAVSRISVLVYGNTNR